MLHVAACGCVSAWRAAERRVSMPVRVGEWAGWSSWGLGLGRLGLALLGGLDLLMDLA